VLGAGHQLVAANITVGLASVGLVRPAEAVGLTIGALITAAGPFSPDADNRPPLAGVMRHRGALHWWGWPAGVALVLAAAGAPVLAYGPVIGWWSHVVADALVGAGGYSIPKGVPLWPWGRTRIGTGLKVTGRWWGHSLAELTLTVAFGVVLAVQVVTLRLA
jgi:hypothetical protein